MQQLANSQLCADRFRELWNNKLRTKEVIYILYLDEQKRQKYHFQLCAGNYKACGFDIREAVHKAFDAESDYMVIAHNHTSGIAEPSQIDIELTLSIEDTLARLDIVLLDHIILTVDDYYSFKDNGYLNGQRSA